VRFFLAIDCDHTHVISQSTPLIKCLGVTQYAYHVELSVQGLILTTVDRVFSSSKMEEACLVSV
jgi:hypothetical protein